MPDPTNQTISASQAAGLFNASKYVTRWMLFQKFANGVDIDPDDNSRMFWGRALESAVLEHAAEELNFEIIPNRDAEGRQAYVRRGQLGCSRDAEIIAPDIGPGAFEVKCVWDWRVWANEWEGGDAVPRGTEIQLQEQMLVGDGKEPFRWGVIGAFVSGEVHYFRREPVLDFWGQLEDEAEAFFEEVKAGKAPDPFGATVETPILSQLRTVRETREVDLSDDVTLAEQARLYDWARTRRLQASKTEEKAKAKLLAGMGDATHGDLFGGIKVDIKSTPIEGGVFERKPYVRDTVKVRIPDVLPDTLLGDEV